MGTTSKHTLTRFRGPGAIDPWVSAAYIGKMLYEIDSYPDGHVETYATPTDPNVVVDLKTSYYKEPVCKPAGTYTMLVVFLDFGNLTFTPDQLMADLSQAPATVNREDAAYTVAGPGSAPILQIQTKGVLIHVPASMWKMSMETLVRK